MPAEAAILDVDGTLTLDLLGAVREAGVAATFESVDELRKRLDEVGLSRN